MKYLLQDEKLTFVFGRYSVSCDNYSYGYSYGDYQANGILSFAIMDLALKIIKQQKRKSIILKKRKPIIHMLNYVDTFNLNFNGNKFDITFLSKNKYKTELAYNLYLYRTRPFKDFAKECLNVIERKDLCIIRFEYDFASKVQPKNSNFVAMLMHIFDKEEIDTIYNADGIVFYCLLLM
jgi:hypothetical protein